MGHVIKALNSSGPKVRGSRTEVRVRLAEESETRIMNSSTSIRSLINPFHLTLGTSGAWLAKSVLPFAQCDTLVA